jgi:ABC-type sugar transport system substrate-binding protein
MKEGILKTSRIFLLILMALIFAVVTMGEVQASSLQIQPKGKKKIKIAVVDWISAIEPAAIANANYTRLAKERGWELQVFDVKTDASKVQGIMQNIISAGYDGVIVNWTDFKYFGDTIMKAYKAGIPVQGVACGNMVPGVVSEGVSSDMVIAAMSSLYLATKVPSGSKILMYLFPQDATSVARADAAKVTFKHYRLPIAQELQWGGQGDYKQQGYEQIKNALLADTKKEIKGIWTAWEGWGVAAAQAVTDMKRPDIFVTTNDDSASTYSDMRRYPCLIATAGTTAANKEWTARLFHNFDEIFAGKEFPDGDVWFATAHLVTRDNMPPPGYYYSECGYKGRAPDFKVK